MSKIALTLFTLFIFNIPYCVQCKAELMEMPFIVSVDVMNVHSPTECGGNVAALNRQYCISVKYTTRTINFNGDSKPTYYSLYPYFGIISFSNDEKNSTYGILSDANISYKPTDTWRDILNNFYNKNGKSGTVSLPVWAHNPRNSSVCLAVISNAGTSNINYTSIETTPCMPVPRPNVSCKVNVAALDYNFGTKLPTQVSSGVEMSKSFVLNCSEDTTVLFNLTSTGGMKMYNENADELPVQLTMDGKKLSANSPLSFNESSGDNNHVLKLSIEKSSPSEGSYSGTEVIIISPQ